MNNFYQPMKYIHFEDPQNIIPLDTAIQNTTPENTTPKDATVENTIIENPIAEHQTKKNKNTYSTSDSIFTRYRATRPCPPRPLSHTCRNVSFLYATNAAGGTLNSSTTPKLITFPTIVAINGNRITYTAGAPTIILRESGVYEVMYNVTYSLAFSPPTSTVNESIHTYLTLNDSEITGANLTSTLVNNTTIAHSASTLVIINSNTMTVPTGLKLNVGPLAYLTTFWIGYN